MENTPDLFLLDAADVARKRLDRYLDKKLTKISEPGRWEFYNYLLEKAQKHEPDGSYKQLNDPAYQADEAAAKKSWEDYNKDRERRRSPYLGSPPSDNSRRGEQTR